MDVPCDVTSVYWDEGSKSWRDRVVRVDEHHGSADCQRCGRPMSHNVRTGGEFCVIYVRCGCSRHVV